MSKSVKRVQRAAIDLEIDIDVKSMPQSTKTAQEAASACGCSVGQIVKSLVFEGKQTGKLILILVSGSHELDLEKVAEQLGEPLKRAHPKRIREETGFAIGGVAPIGHLNTLDSWIDKSLLSFDVVWAAAGAPNAVFEIKPKELQRITGATSFTVS